MAPKGGSKQQSEEDLLLQDFSRNLSAKSSALFFGNAFIVSAIPIWLYWRIWHMDLIQSAVLYSVMTLVSTYLVAFAYKNVKFVLKHKVAQKREDAVSKEVTRKLSEADNRKMSRKEKDERKLRCSTSFLNTKSFRASTPPPCGVALLTSCSAPRGHFRDLVTCRSNYMEEGRDGLVHLNISHPDTVLATEPQ
uniref:Translocon-associated protein subunit gamma n=1 Tax=Canis lupus familiaris TaxID=9615 RepID=A0A8P0TKL1_CANLF